MRFKRTAQRTVTEDSRTVCDLCDSSTKGQWFYCHDDVTIEARLGEVYPENDHRRVLEIDCCASCFESKVVPAIEALGCKFSERKVDDDGRVEDAR